MAKKTRDVKQEQNVSDILESFGKYQIIQYVYLCLPTIFVAMSTVNFIFVAGDVNYRCRVPECETNETYNTDWWPNTHTDHCTKPVLNHTYFEGNVCTNNSFSDAIEDCSEWIYKNNNTIVSELNLACQPWQRSLVGPVHGLGLAFAMVIGGWLSDVFGRKPTLIICSIGCILGNLKTLASSYLVYICLEFLEAAISGGTLAAVNVLMIEIGNKKNRMLAGVLFAYSIYMGEALFAILAMLVPYWKSLLYVICSPPVLFMTYAILVEDSPRWLILNGKVDQAKHTLKKMVKMNKLNTKLEDLDNLNESTLKQTYNIETHANKEGFQKVFKSREILKRFFVSLICRFNIAFIYYGLIMNSVWLPGNKYLYFFLGALMSFPGEAISLVLMNKIGRRQPLIYGYSICGLICVIYGCIPESHTWIKIGLFLIGKLLASSCFTGVLTFTMELFPTSVRGSLLGLCTVSICAGNMMGYLTPMMTPISPLLAPICFGCAGVVSSALIILLPETKDLPLFDTIDQVDKSAAIEKNNKEVKQCREEINLGFSQD